MVKSIPLRGIGPLLLLLIQTLNHENNVRISIGNREYIACICRASGMSTAEALIRFITMIMFSLSIFSQLFSTSTFDQQNVRTSR